MKPYKYLVVFDGYTFYPILANSINKDDDYIEIIAQSNSFNNAKKMADNFNKS